MSEDRKNQLDKEIIEFHEKLQLSVRNSITLYRSMLRDETALKRLLDRIGEIPSIQRPDNEHKADT